MSTLNTITFRGLADGMKYAFENHREATRDQSQYAEPSNSIGWDQSGREFTYVDTVNSRYSDTVGGKKTIATSNRVVGTESVRYWKLAY